MNTRKVSVFLKGKAIRGVAAIAKPAAFLIAIAKRTRPMNRHFGRIYCLTLKRTPRRAIGQIARFVKYGIYNYEIVFGTTVTKRQKKKLLASGAITSNFYDLTEGEIGCALGHRRIWAEAISRGDQRILVFEDDVELTRGFAARFGISRGDVATGDGTEIVYLGRGGVTIKTWSLLDDQSTGPCSVEEYARQQAGETGGDLVVAGPSTGTYAYALNRVAMEELCSKTRVVDRPIDTIFANLASDGLLSAKAFSPPLCRHRAGASVVGNIHKEKPENCGDVLMQDLRGGSWVAEKALICCVEFLQGLEVSHVVVGLSRNGKRYRIELDRADLQRVLENLRQGKDQSAVFVKLHHDELKANTRYFRLAEFSLDAADTGRITMISVGRRYRSADDRLLYGLNFGCDLEFRGTQDGAEEDRGTDGRLRCSARRTTWIRLDRDGMLPKPRVDLLCVASDRDEWLLRYHLRSILMYADFIRRVYLFVPSRPIWLQRETPGMTVVEYGGGMFPGQPEKRPACVAGRGLGEGLIADMVPCVLVSDARTLFTSYVTADYFFDRNRLAKIERGLLEDGKWCGAETKEGRGGRSGPPGSGIYSVTKAMLRGEAQTPRAEIDALEKLAGGQPPQDLLPKLVRRAYQARQGVAVTYKARKYRMDREWDRKRLRKMLAEREAARPVLLRLEPGEEDWDRMGTEEVLRRLFPFSSIYEDGR